ncbi:MAG: 1-(5-phosphoribosyl)-5-[(5-phosphoribosylamino)methylideneamino]imidazole-4-carboxamide isomerase [Chloroflexi bacterium]|nr:1-(5-phosphoribosyl)-5-[(5-phosphoribosylamino)methylideneamino]imidazole-4-carboxamide isomerase [Chloroflexota bacterium]
MPFILLPAVDILGGRCVRLVQGDYERVTVFNDDPLHVAQHWEALGAEWLHIVDLDGARNGTPINRTVIETIARSTSLKLEVSGGIRTREQIDHLLHQGIARVVLGTAAVEYPDLVADSCQQWGNKIAVAIDSRNGKVATHGWLVTTTVTSVDLVQRMVQLGVQTIIATDIDRDGTLTAPNFSGLSRLATQTSASVIASGGITTITQLLQLRDLGLAGAIIGRALYDGQLNFSDALSAFKSGGVPC